MIILALILAWFRVDLAALHGESLSFTTPCTISVEQGENTMLLLPVRHTHWNMNQGGEPNGLGVDTLFFAVSLLEAMEYSVLSPGSPLPNAGTFYISADTTLKAPDTLSLVEPPHFVLHATVQVSLRPGDTYTDYLFELINTPFIMAPRNTPMGHHQSDSRLGTDCAGLAVYGRRRMGEEGALYLGPRGIIPMLERMTGHEYRLTDGVFLSQEGSPASAPEPGDILHFEEQVSIFLEDRGEEGILDGEDLLIQSWFDGPHVCPAADNGFSHMPVVLYRWRP